MTRNKVNEQRISELQIKFKGFNGLGVPKKWGGEEKRQKKKENNCQNLSKFVESYKPTDAKSQRTSSTKT